MRVVFFCACVISLLVVDMEMGIVWVSGRIETFQTPCAVNKHNSIDIDGIALISKIATGGGVVYS
jgi:hypothetical protein